MEKAYDAKALLEQLKGHGLDVAEELASAVVESVLDWVAESAALSENKYDDIIAPFIPTVKPHILDLIDKIDGEEG